MQTTYVHKLEDETIVREFVFEVEFTHEKGCGPSWGYAGGDPGEPESVEITGLRLLHVTDYYDGNLLDRKSVNAHTIVEREPGEKEQVAVCEWFKRELETDPDLVETVEAACFAELENREAVGG